MYAKHGIRWFVAAIALAVLVTAIQQGGAQEQGWFFSHPPESSAFPWNAPDYRGYDEPEHVTRAISATAPTSEAQKYAMNAKPLPEVNSTQKSNVVTIVAHVPENAQIWFFDQLTTSRGKTRVFHSPTVGPGGKYAYTVRIAWVEAGKVVSESQTFSVVPGEVHAIYLKRNETKKKAG